MAKWARTKKDTFAVGQVWASFEGGQRLITKIEDGRVYFDTVCYAPSSNVRPRKHVGYVSLHRFSVWSSRLVENRVHSSRHQPMEVVNVRQAQ